MADVYQKLRKQLDQYSVGFPETKSGVEMKILKRLFTEEDAEMYLQLSMLLEAPESVADRLGRDKDEVADHLHRMSENGLIFRHQKGDAVKYAASPFVVGIYEYQLPTMDKELAGMVDQFMEEAFSKNMGGDMVVLRPIPINRSVDVSHPVAPYEVSREILKSQKKIAVANCICRVQQGLLEKACDKPVEVCLVFGSHADYYVSRKMARFIDIDEAMKIVDISEEAGLVSQPFNARNPGGMCNCCGDCCGVLRGLNAHPNPASIVTSNYFAKVDEELCVGCEVCLDRCQMNAISMNDDGVAEINRDRCIGCGLCVPTCASEAMGLELKPEDQRVSPPDSAMKHALEMAEKRGATLTPLYMKQ